MIHLDDNYALAQMAHQFHHPTLYGQNFLNTTNNNNNQESLNVNNSNNVNSNEDRSSCELPQQTSNKLNMVDTPSYFNNTNKNNELFCKINEENGNSVKDSISTSPSSSLSSSQSLSVATISSTSSNASLSPPSTTSIVKNRLHITNIPFKFKAEDLRDMCEQYGEVLESQIIENGRGSKGFGFVTFVNIADAERAKEKLNDQIIEGRKITVNNATEKKQNKAPYYNPKIMNANRRPTVIQTAIKNNHVPLFVRNGIPNTIALTNDSHLKSGLNIPAGAQLPATAAYTIFQSPLIHTLSSNNTEYCLNNIRSLNTAARYIPGNIATNMNNISFLPLTVNGNNENTNFYLPTNPSGQYTQNLQQLYTTESLLANQSQYENIISYQNSARGANIRYAPY